jgi:hypothetical protein
MSSALLRTRRRGARTLDVGKAQGPKEVDDVPDVIPCPDPACLAPAEILDRWTWPSTDGPVEHVRTRCRRGHVFTPMVETLQPQAGERVAAAVAATGR